VTADTGVYTAATTTNGDKPLPRKVLAVQQETSSILSRVESRRTKLPKGMSARTDIASDVLGAVQAKAALRAGEALGVSADEIVGPYREQRHYEAAERARRMELVAGAIPTERSIPQPPFRKSAGSPQGVGDYGAGGKLFVPRRRGQVLKPSTRPSWK
jgi:hypothetical protein